MSSAAACCDGRERDGEQGLRMSCERVIRDWAMHYYNAHVRHPSFVTGSYRALVAELMHSLPVEQLVKLYDAVVVRVQFSGYHQRHGVAVVAVPKQIR